MICRRPRISPDSSTLVSHFGTTSYMFPWMSGLRWRLYSEAIQFHVSLSTQFSSKSVYHYECNPCQSNPTAHQFLQNHIQYHCCHSSVSVFSAQTWSAQQYVPDLCPFRTLMICTVIIYYRSFILGLTVIFMYLDTSMGMPASSIY